tara:strand:+ start:1457 stop:2065 length:609 start_codon:yes stop_codon:yes gene_type:complete
MILNRVSLLSLLVVSTCSNLAPADTPCDYENNINTEYTKKIEKVLDFDKKVYPYVEDTRKCVINMNIVIDGTIHHTMGDYVFGPDVTENFACKNAENRAKETIIRKVSPEILSAKTDMSCKAKTVEKIKTKKIDVVQNQKIELPPIGTEYIVDSKVVEYPQTISTSEYRDIILGNNRTPALNASHKQGILTGIALELMRWIH